MADKKPLRILVLCTKFPWPPKDGGAIAMLNMIRAFHKAGEQVTVVSMNTPKHYVQLKDVPDELRESAEFFAVDVNTNVRVADMLANFIFSKKAYHVQRFTSKAFTAQLESVLQQAEFDIVQLETLYMTPYIPTIRKHSKALIALRAHNIENEIWKRRAENEYNPFKKYLFAETALRIKRYENATMGANKFDMLIPITGRDEGMLKKMGVKKPSFTCQAGVDLERLDKRDLPMEYPSVFYIGALDWEPNREGLAWFLKEVWPQVHARFPEVPFYIAGRNMPDQFRLLSGQNIKPLGEVESASEFYKTKAVMVVPILSGSGMRVKIVEGMAYGKAIVATYRAAEGLGVYDGNQIMIADNPGEFAERVGVLLEQRSLYNALSDHAQSFVKKRFDADQLAKRLLNFYRGQISNRQKAEEEKKKKKEQ